MGNAIYGLTIIYVHIDIPRSGSQNIDAIEDIIAITGRWLSFVYFVSHFTENGVGFSSFVLQYYTIIGKYQLKYIQLEI